MNVAYTDISSQDAANSIGVSISTIQGWCRNRLINFVDIGDGNKKARYMISEPEVNYLKSLVKEHGKKKAMLYYDKAKNQYPTTYETKGEYDLSKYDYKFEETTPIPTPAEEENIPTRKTFDKDTIVATVSYIQDIKERLNDLEAEKNQLLNELELMKKEVLEYIG